MDDDTVRFQLGESVCPWRSGSQLFQIPGPHSPGWLSVSRSLRRSAAFTQKHSCPFKAIVAGGFKLQGELPRTASEDLNSEDRPPGPLKPPHAQAEASSSRKYLLAPTSPRTASEDLYTQRESSTCPFKAAAVGGFKLQKVSTCPYIVAHSVQWRICTARIAHLSL